MSQKNYNHVINVIFQPKNITEVRSLKVDLNIKSSNKTITTAEISKAVKKLIAEKKATHDFVEVLEKNIEDVVTTILQ